MDWNIFWDPFVKCVLPLLVTYGLAVLGAYLTQLAKRVRDERVQNLIDTVVIGVEQIAKTVEKQTGNKHVGVSKLIAARDA